MSCYSPYSYSPTLQSFPFAASGVRDGQGSQVLRTTRSGTFLPGLPSSSCVLKLRLTRGKDTSDNASQEKQARHPAKKQRHRVKKERHENRGTNIRRNEALNQNTKNKKNTTLEPTAALGGTTSID